ncbi:N-acetyltransferase ESCO2 [Anomaloglossus baeobatrachus]|uniref:N-acetyltransferase ESCO2 n=1 Tax=Anomaloglossus baeobatrachus TaxID=238106 RepID=UPI003F4FD908
MAARTPRKRKQSWGAADGLSSFGTPVKKLSLDCSVVLTPLRSRNPNSSSGATIITKASPPAPPPRCASIEDDKENIAASAQRGGVARKLIVSPQPADAYVFSPVKSPSPRSAVPTVSFYKKQSDYMTPIDRKLISDHKGHSGQEMSPPTTRWGGEEPAKVTRTRRPPSAKKKKTVKTDRKNKSPPTPKNRSPTLQNPERSETSPEEPAAQKTAILGLKVKPRPKLMVGAAFFATSKKPHTVSRRPPANAKNPVTSKPSVRPAKKSAAPAAKSGVSAAAKSGVSAAAKSGVSAAAKSGVSAAAKSGVSAAAKSGVSAAAKSGVSAAAKSGVSAAAKSGVSAAPAAKSGVSVTGKKMVAGGKGQSERQKGSNGEKTPEEESDRGQECAEGAADGSQIMFDSDDPIVKSAEKKDSTVYPIFSTLAVTKKRPLDFRGDLASPVCSSTPAAAKAPKLSKKKDGKKVGDDQLIIDAGQKHFGPVSCGSCGMIFSASSVEDEAQHAQYHQRLLESIRYVGWKKERIVAESWDGKIIMICPDDPKYALRKAEEVRELVDAELGFQQTSLNSPARTRTYLYVTGNKIAGCLIAEPIRQAFRVLAEPPSPENRSLERHRAWRCSSDPQPAICGISRIWVFAPMRRRSIASRLVDAVRSSFIYGSHLSTEEIAFSDPTPDGKLFASTYCAVPDFLVYNFLS